MKFGIKLNKEEIALGILYGVMMAPILKWATIITFLTTWLLWSLGGSGKGHGWRWAGCPFALAIAMIVSTGRIENFIAAALTAIALCQGYGIPTVNAFGDITDAGSPLGAFWWRKLDKNQYDANVMTKASIGVLIAICLSPIILTGHLAIWTGSIFLLGIGFPLIAIFVEGEITI